MSARAEYSTEAREFIEKERNAADPLRTNSEREGSVLLSRCAHTAARFKRKKKKRKNKGSNKASDEHAASSHTTASKLTPAAKHGVARIF